MNMHVCECARGLRSTEYSLCAKCDEEHETRCKGWPSPEEHSHQVKLWGKTTAGQQTTHTPRLHFTDKDSEA